MRTRHRNANVGQAGDETVVSLEACKRELDECFDRWITCTVTLRDQQHQRHKQTASGTPIPEAA